MRVWIVAVIASCAVFVSGIESAFAVGYDRGGSALPTTQEVEGVVRREEKTVARLDCRRRPAPNGGANWFCSVRLRDGREGSLRIHASRHGTVRAAGRGIPGFVVVAY